MNTYVFLLNQTDFLLLTFFQTLSYLNGIVNRQVKSRGTLLSFLLFCAFRLLLTPSAKFLMEVMMRSRSV